MGFSKPDSVALSSGLSIAYSGGVTILDSLGIVPDLAASMTRNLVAYSGDYWSTGGHYHSVEIIYDQSGNGRNLVNAGTVELTPSGSGDSARAVFASSGGYSRLSTGTAGGSFPAGGHDLFMVIDTPSADKQTFISDTSAPTTDCIVMQNGSGTAAVSSAMTAGDIRVNDSVLSPQDRDELYDTMLVSGMNVFSVEDLVLSTLDATVYIGVSNTVWKLEGSFAEFIITPPLTDAAHSAIVADIRAFYG